MPLYRYKAKKGPHQTVEDTLEASSIDDAVDRLSSLGLTVVSLTEVQPEGQSQQLLSSGSRKRISSEDVDVLTRQLAGLAASGVPLLKGLSLLARQTASAGLRGVLSSMEKDIRAGSSFSEALSAFPRVFNDLFVGMVKAGEKSGSLAEALQGLAQYRGRERELRQKVTAALVYPVFMIVLGVLTVFLMLTFFLPKYVTLFADMKQTLPLATRMLMSLSAFMSANWYCFAVIPFAFFFVFPPGGLKKGSRRKIFLDRMMLRLPLISVLVRNSETARFTRTLALLVKSGIPVAEGIRSAAEVLDNDILKTALLQARMQIINEGRALSEALAGAHVLPDFALGMMATGEENGRLEWALGDVADVYEREVEQSLKIVTTLIEPVLILLTGIVVGFIVFAMLLPIFNMSFAHV